VAASFVLEAYDESGMQPAPAECQERKILEGRYHADFKVYVAVVRSLEQALNTEDFNQIYQNAELAKRAFEKARDDLEVHISTHVCSIPE